MHTQKIFTLYPTPTPHHTPPTHSDQFSVLQKKQQAQMFDLSLTASKGASKMEEARSLLSKANCVRGPQKSFGTNALACFSLCSSDRSIANIIKVEVCGFLNPVSSLAVAFFVALINHFALWSQLDHPYHVDNTLTPISLCG